MSQSNTPREYDAIIIGSGSCGATLARELSRKNWKVLVLERGGQQPLRETLGSIVSIAEQVKLGDGRLGTVRGITTGGSTALYFGVANYPPLESFAALGMDLTQDLQAIRQEIPLAPVPDNLLSPQTRLLREAAVSQGHDWQKFDLMVDLSKCNKGYAYEAKWKARTFVDEAVRNGAVLVTQANVHKIIVQERRAVGVEYKIKTGFSRHEVRQAYGRKIIVAAGETATPKLLRDNGIQGVGSRGFYCSPGYAIYGVVPGLKGHTGFVGSMGCLLEEGVEIADANIPQPLHKPMMLGGLKFRHFFNYPGTVGIGVKVKDELGGELRADGRFYKRFSQQDYQRLQKGRAAAVKILEKTGAQHIGDFGINGAGRVGGLLRIGEHVDERLETEIRNLHVCDGSVIPDDMRGTPTVTLLAMARYLSRQLLAAG